MPITPWLLLLLCAHTPSPPQTKQPAYLGSQGLAARGLLTGGDTSSSNPLITVGDAASSSSTNNNDGDSSSTNLLDDVSAWAADCVEGVGFAVVRLGRWMRSKLAGADEQQQGHQEQQEQEAGSSSKGAADEGPFMQRVGGGALAVMVAMVAIVCVVLLGKGHRS